MNPLDLLPQDRRAAAKAALDSTFPGACVGALTPMAGGASGAGVYRVEVDGRPAVLRLDLPAGGFNDPARHYACHRIAAQAGVAPALLYANADDRIAVSEFVAAVPATGQLPAIARAVRRLHDAPLFPVIAPYFTAMESVLGFLAETNAMPDAAMADAWALLARVAQAYRLDPADQVSTHTDLNPGNILFDGERVLIVDWAAGFAADRYVDLSSLLNFFAHDAEREEIVLTNYFGRPATAHERAKAQAMRQVNRLFYGAVMIATVAAGRPGMRLAMSDLEMQSFADIRHTLTGPVTPDGMATMGRVFFSDAMRGAREPAFAAALDALRA